MRPWAYGVSIVAVAALVSAALAADYAMPARPAPAAQNEAQRGAAWQHDRDVEQRVPGSRPADLH